MNCANILIVYFDDKDTETNEARGLLKERYADRSLNMIKFSYDVDGASCFVTEGPESAQRPGDTGIYVIQHGASGFTGYLAQEGVRKAFVNWLLSLADPPKSLKIRKLCFITCTAVEVDFKGVKARPVQAKAADGGKIYVPLRCFVWVVLRLGHGWDS